MENKLHNIIRNHISIPEDEISRNNQILASVLPKIIDSMKKKDPLFKAMYRRTFYGGSYYDGLKVGKPEEFDLDLLLDVPKYAEPELLSSGYPGFVKVRVNKYHAWMKQPEATPSYEKFAKLFDSQCNLNTEKTLAWMEGLVQKSLNDFQNERVAPQITFSKSGPALTLHVSESNKKIMDIDLVPCFVFGSDKWPKGFRSNPVPSKPEFFIVPKRPNNCKKQEQSHHWRLSFQEQERELISDKMMLKPTVKLLKIMRDMYEDRWMASYYIKTVFLHLCDQKNEQFWKSSLTHVFKTTLRDYKDVVKNGKIPYYWNENNNLIANISNNCIENFTNRLERLLQELEKNPENVESCLLRQRKQKRSYWTGNEFSHRHFTDPRNDLTTCAGLLLIIFLLNSTSFFAFFQSLLISLIQNLPLVIFSVMLLFVLYLIKKFIDFVKSLPQEVILKYSSVVAVITCSFFDKNPRIFLTFFSACVFYELLESVRIAKNDISLERYFPTVLIVITFTVHHANPLYLVLFSLVLVGLITLWLIIWFLCLKSELIKTSTFLVFAFGTYNFPPFVLIVPALATFLLVWKTLTLGIKYLTVQHYRMLAAGILCFQFAPDIFYLLRIIVFLMLAKVLTWTLNVLLSIENIIVTLFMLSSFFLSVFDVQESAIFLFLHGFVLIIIKMIVLFLGNLKLENCVALALVLSCFDVE